MKSIPLKERKISLPFPHDPSIETIRRTIYKTITYRVIISILHFTVVYFITGRARIALGFVILSSAYSIFIFYFHDRIWDRIKWGKVDPD
jgi:uncharacterized membrane protein